MKMTKNSWAENNFSSNCISPYPGITGSIKTDIYPLTFLILWQNR